MAIYRILQNNAAFDPNAIKAMPAAYEGVLRSLKLDDRSDPLTEVIAKKIIEAAKTGMLDPDLLQQSVLQEIARR